MKIRHEEMPELFIVTREVKTKVAMIKSHKDHVSSNKETFYTFPSLNMLKQEFKKWPRRTFSTGVKKVLNETVSSCSCPAVQAAQSARDFFQTLSLHEKDDGLNCVVCVCVWRVCVCVCVCVCVWPHCSGLTRQAPCRITGQAPEVLGPVLDRSLQESKLFFRIRPTRRCDVATHSQLRIRIYICHIYIYIYI